MLIGRGQQPPKRSLSISLGFCFFVFLFFVTPMLISHVHRADAGAKRQFETLATIGALQTNKVAVRYNDSTRQSNRKHRAKEHGKRMCMSVCVCVVRRTKSERISILSKARGPTGPHAQHEPRPAESERGEGHPTPNPGAGSNQLSAELYERLLRTYPIT